MLLFIFFLLLTACSGEKPSFPEQPAHPFALHDPGSSEVIDYSKYGEFENLNTPSYHYKIKNKAGLSKEVGEGIYPNISLNEDPEFLRNRLTYISNPLKMDFYTHLNGTRENFYRLMAVDLNLVPSSMTNQPEGLRLYLLGKIFEDAQMWNQALKAYYALLVHFPDTIAKESSKTGISVGNRAIYLIQKITSEHPELGVQLEGAEIYIDEMDEESKKVYRLNPGKFVKTKAIGSPSLTSSDITYRSGHGKVQAVKYKNDTWQLLVNGNPYFIKGLVTNINKIGNAPDFHRLNQWERNDSHWYLDSWTDLNKNNQKDPGEECWNDIELFKALGVNTIRIYYGATNKRALHDLYEKAGIRFVMGMPIGEWSFDSNVEYPSATDYSNEEQQNVMLERVKEMVLQHKDEPYLLLWLLGNENNLGFGSNAKTDPKSFAQFLEKAVQMVHQIDPDHPVAYSNGDVKLINYFKEYTPNLDIFATNMYRRDLGFEELWDRVKTVYDKPVFVSEFGFSAYMDENGENETLQALYLKTCWQDIEYNKAGGKGAGNSFGGIVFEWLDEWSKEGSPYRHDKVANAPGSWIYEEWLGIVSQGNGYDSPNMRQLREAYFTLQKLWNPEGAKSPMLPCSSEGKTQK